MYDKIHYKKKKKKKAAYCLGNYTSELKLNKITQDILSIILL